MTARNRLLYGTEQEPTPLRRFQAGPLGFSLDGGNVRYVTWRGQEILRAISFIVRDSKWGTYAPEITAFSAAHDETGVSIGYSASVAGPEGDFTFSAKIRATSTGNLSFAARGSSHDGFTTNRTGFVVLHGLAGVTGAPVEVGHASGGRETSRFPRLVDASQPIMDIRSLSHSPMPGLTVTVTMEGETFEMEDQRNWTDASFKTYVRPLSKGYPYVIAAGETIEQRVVLEVSETGERARIAETPGPEVIVGGADGVLPEIGLALGSWTDSLPITPSFVIGRIDLTSGAARLPSAPAGVPVDLDVIIAGRDPNAELAALAALTWRPRRVLVVPQRDMASRPGGQTPDGEADAATILRAARRVFPQCGIGGGMLVGFPELNRNRPPPDIDFIAHSTSAIVHAADDHSVMETHEALGSVVDTVRSFAGAVRYRLGPATIGAPQPFYAAPSAANPDGLRLTTADEDPRQSGLFAAAFAIGYAAAVAGRVEDLVLGATNGAAGVLGPGGRHPVAMAIGWLAALAGRTRLHVEAPAGLAVIAANTPTGRVLVIANRTAEPIEFSVRDFGDARILDAAAMASGEGPRPAATRSPILLDAYAICRISDE